MCPSFWLVFMSQHRKQAGGTEHTCWPVALTLVVMKSLGASCYPTTILLGLNKQFCRQHCKPGPPLHLDSPGSYFRILMWALALTSSPQSCSRTNSCSWVCLIQVEGPEGHRQGREVCWHTAAEQVTIIQGWLWFKCGFTTHLKMERQVSLGEMVAEAEGEGEVSQKNSDRGAVCKSINHWETRVKQHCPKIHTQYPVSKIQNLNLYPNPLYTPCNPSSKT